MNSSLRIDMTELPRLKPQWFHILLSVADGPLHGTAIMEEVLDRTEGGVRLWPGTLYGCLKELAERGFVREVDPPEGAPREGGKRRFYAVTPTGRVALHREVERLAGYVAVARQKRVGQDPDPA